MRIGLGVAATALVLVSACGGGSDDAHTAKQSQALDLLTPAQACAQVQMVNDELGGPGDWPIPTYGEFGQKTADLAGQSDPKIANAIKAMSDQAVTVGGMSLSGDGGVDTAQQAASEWAGRYQDVADICARTDSPLSRLP